MKCKQCGREIPGAFTDCPWCGAVAGIGNGTGDSSGSLTHSLLIAISTVTSGMLFVVLSYFAATRTNGPLTLGNSGYFLGRCAGALILGAVVVFGYRKLTDAKLRGPVQALLTLTVASLAALLSLALPARPRLAGIDPATVRKYSDVAQAHKPEVAPVNKTKWDPAARSLMKDVQARNQQYVAEISTLDETSKPLYTPQSFHDADAIRQTIDQLHARQAVADKYTDWQPVFSKMKDYVAAVDATDAEKQKYMQGFDASLPKTLAVCKIISDKEHAWLQASLDLYQFVLAKEGTFAWRPDNLVFQKRSDSEAFRQKFIKARTLNMQFLQAYWQVKQAQEAMMAQLGLQDAEGNTPRPN
jgi:hypothetical protein